MKRSIAMLFTLFLFAGLCGCGRAPAKPTDIDLTETTISENSTTSEETTTSAEETTTSAEETTAKAEQNTTTTPVAETTEPVPVTTIDVTALLPQQRRYVQFATVQEAIQRIHTLDPLRYEGGLYYDMLTPVLADGFLWVPYDYAQLAVTENSHKEAGTLRCQYPYEGHGYVYNYYGEGKAFQIGFYYLTDEEAQTAKAEMFRACSGKGDYWTGQDSLEKAVEQGLKIETRTIQGQSREVMYYRSNDGEILRVWFLLEERYIVTVVPIWQKCAEDLDVLAFTEGLTFEKRPL